MRFVNDGLRCVVLLGLLAFGFVGCANDDGGDRGSNGTSFALESCENSDQCGAGFECAVFPCPADCDADTDGGCDTCQAGAICLPQPPADCDPDRCGSAQVCQRSCSGACDLAVGQCYDVACQMGCLPVGTPTEPDPDQACVTDFTDACLPPNYPVAARLDDVCAAQGLVLTDVSVAAECWPGAVQFQWTCCRREGTDPVPEPWCERACDDNGVCFERCCDPTTGECWDNGQPGVPTCRTECFEDGLCYETCCDPMTGQCWTTDPNQPPSCYPECDAAGTCYDVCCDQNTGECWGGGPQQPYCYVECDQTDPDGACTEVCCDPATGACWGDEPTEPPTQVCVEGGYDECLPEGIDVKERAWADCAAQNLELTSLEVAYACDNGFYAYKWTCCSADVTQPPAPTCEKQCDANDPTGACVEVCCDPATGECWTNGPTEPTECWKECTDDGTCYETCCDAYGQCWTNGTDQPPPPDPNACITQVAGGDGTCTDLETLLAYASWTCAASGLALTETGSWGECDGGFQGLKFSCCPF